MEIIFFQEKGRVKKKISLRNERGYAYVMVLAAVVVLAVLAETAYVTASYQVKRDKEEELLFRGLAYQNAIQSYYLSSPAGTRRTFPMNLEDLLSDPRFPSRKRHLRALYSEPFGKEWNLVKEAGGGISGVASSSQEKPLKRANFSTVFSNFEGAQRYSEWIFLFQPNSTALNAKPPINSGP